MTVVSTEVPRIMNAFTARSTATAARVQRAIAALNAYRGLTPDRPLYWLINAVSNDIKSAAERGDTRVTVDMLPLMSSMTPDTAAVLPEFKQLLSTLGYECELILNGHEHEPSCELILSWEIPS